MNTTVITPSDVIFATVISGGQTICNVTIAGISTMAELVREVSCRLSGIAHGLVTILVRNGSQGWSLRRLLRLGGDLTAQRC